MMRKAKKLSLQSQGLRHKLRIAFYLMSVIPLLVCIYLVSNYILPQRGFKLDVLVTVLVSVVVTGFGFFVIKEIFDTILTVASDAKLIAAGELNRTIRLERNDEIGDLGQALNQLTLRVRDSMEELKGYSQRTVEIDVDIQKRLFVLSTILQVNALISQGAKLEDILRMTIEKSRLLANSELSYLFLRRETTDAFLATVVDGLNAERVLEMKLMPSDETFSGLINAGKSLILDKGRTLPRQGEISFRQRFALKNTLAFPVRLKEKVIGVIGIGNNRDNFSYSRDDEDFLDMLAKQLAIALENDMLTHRVGKLEIKDELTGLYNNSFITNRLEEEIKRAIIYQRPCSFIMLNIDNFQRFYSEFGTLYAETVLKKIALIIRDSVTEIDRVARTSDNEFAIVLPERNKRQALYIAEEIRKKIEFSFAEEQEPQRRLTVSGGVSENPLDGVTASELITSAKKLLEAAKSHGKNKILS